MGRFTIHASSLMLTVHIIQIWQLVREKGDGNRLTEVASSHFLVFAITSNAARFRNKFNINRSEIMHATMRNAP